MLRCGAVIVLLLYLKTKEVFQKKANWKNLLTLFIELLLQERSRIQGERDYIKSNPIVWNKKNTVRYPYLFQALLLEASISIFLLTLYIYRKHCERSKAIAL